MKQIKNSKPTSHIFIIWNKSLYKKNEIIEDVTAKFVIREVYEIRWTPSLFEDNVSRFYGATLPDPRKKTIECGDGPFLVLVVTDTNPKYEKRGFNKNKLVNSNIFNAKRKYRKWLGGGFHVHGSITEKETNHNLTLLLGKNLNDIIKSLPPKWDNEIKKINRDLSGFNGWHDFSELIYVLNNTTNYVFLRNFENFPDSLISNDHTDIDILTDDLWQIPYIVNKQLRQKDESGPTSYVKVLNKKIKFDFKYPGDNYYDSKWEKNILSKKIKSEKGFFIPDPKNYFYSLLYHMIIHNDSLSEDYLKILTELSLELKITNFNDVKNDFTLLKQLLDRFMEKNDYHYTNSASKKFIHNEIFRIINSAYQIGKKQGFGKMIRAGRDKLYRRNLLKSGRI